MNADNTFTDEEFEAAEKRYDDTVAEMFDSAAKLGLPKPSMKLATRTAGILLAGCLNIAQDGALQRLPLEGKPQ